jgi:hypothetical protein
VRCAGESGRRLMSRSARVVNGVAVMSTRTTHRSWSGQQAIHRRSPQEAVQTGQRAARQVGAGIPQGLAEATGDKDRAIFFENDFRAEQPAAVSPR